MPMLALEEQLGRYRILSLIGVGTYSEVYLAHDSKLDRKITLKLIKSEIFSLINEQGTAIKEASILAQLNHPNIVTIFDVFSVGYTIAFVMEYLEGKTLSDIIKEQPTPDELLIMLKQLASAIQEVHSKGIVHGDIKPSNIVLDSSRTVKIIDFGLSKVSDQATRFTVMTQKESAYGSSMMGTLPYMAPELIKGQEGGALADIFALGAVFFELVCGRQAFCANNEAAILNSILRDHPPLITPIVKGLPEALSILISAMLEKETCRRIGSMDAVVEQLAQMTNHTAQTPEFDIELGTKDEEELSHISSKRKWQWAFSTAAAVLIVGAGMVYMFQKNNTEKYMSVTKELAQGFDHLNRYEIKGRLVKAKNTFERILLEDNENAAATAGLALVFLRMYSSENSDPELLSRSENTAELALQLDSNLAVAHLSMGKVLRQRGKLDKAKKYYQNTLMLDPYNRDGIIGLSYLLRREGKVRAAIAILLDAYEHAPHTLRYVDELGVAYYVAGDYEEAQTYFEKSIALSPNNPYSYANLSAVQHLLGNTSLAIVTLQGGLKIRKHRNLYNNLGTYLFFQRQYSQAISAFEGALNLDGGVNDHQIWANLADAYTMVEGKEDKAKKAYRRALTLLTKQYPAWKQDTTHASQVALYHAKIGNVERANEIVSFIEPHSGNTASILFRLAIVKALTNDYAQAYAFLENALELGYPVMEIENTPELFPIRQTPDYHLLLATLNKGKINDR